MDSSGLFMMSPMDAAGEERLRRVRACIRQTFGPGGPGRRTKRTLEMPTVAPTPAKTPRTKLRQRIAQASQLSTEELFFKEFGSSEELLNTEFDLARPKGHPVSTAAAASRRSNAAGASAQSALYPAAASLSTRSYAAQQPAAPISHFSFESSASSKASAFTTVKRGRTGESSAEKALPLRKPRLGGFSARTIDYSNAAGTSFFGATAGSTVDPRRNLSFVTKRGEQLAGAQSYSSRFLSRTSPSKFQFSSNATRLFSQRQAPLR
ncbi:hypothetical protein PHYBOEH_011552 [Phytophthora boehmeriae]|uniref:Uncharacterized protein n=1 Tax=Phytophthora boehmeriae TaxID=109152 RepID=A0A8T1X2A7_9STRA|nr:hypothetical protein PHYBOEH_011552 [Phytophthora boehmeriae]